jgi:hypothetical protein
VAAPSPTLSAEANQHPAPSVRRIASARCRPVGSSTTSVTCGPTRDRGTGGGRESSVPLPHPRGEGVRRRTHRLRADGALGVPVAAEASPPVLQLLGELILRMLVPVLVGEGGAGGQQSVPLAATRKARRGTARQAPAWRGGGGGRMSSTTMSRPPLRARGGLAVGLGLGMPAGSMHRDGVHVERAAGVAREAQVDRGPCCTGHDNARPFSNSSAAPRAQTA